MKLGLGDIYRILGADLPQETTTYKPVAHKIVIDSVKEFCYKNNVTIINEDYLSNGKASQVVGRYTLSLGDDDLKMQIAFKNSYDKSMSFGFAAGATVFLCTNGAVRGEHIFKRRHVGSIQTDLNENLFSTYETLEEELTLISEDFTLLKDREVAKPKLHELMGRMFFEDDIINTEQLQIVKRESEHSQHFKGNSAYDLYNWITESLKSSHPTNYLEKHVKLHKLFLNEFN